MLIDRDTMIPLLDDQGRGVYVTVADIRRKSLETERQDSIRRSRDEALANSVQQRGLAQAVDLDGKTYWVDKETREIYDYTFGEEDLAPRWKKTGKRYGRGVLVRPQGGVVLKDPNVGVEGAIIDGVRAVGRGIGSAASAVYSVLPEVNIGDDAFKD